MTLLAAAGRDSAEWVGPGLLGFVVIMALVVATILLWRNMNKQLKKVHFDDGSEPAEQPAERADDAAPADSKPNGQPT
jgi:hypothetical protein